jgi:acetyltransferase-like isoleucine patch superfamily enzyme
MTGSTWRIGEDGRDPHHGETFLHADGSVSGMRLGHFALWGIQAGQLVFMDGRETVTVRFGAPSANHGKTIFNGDYVGTADDFKTVQVTEYRRLDDCRILGRFDEFLPKSQFLKKDLRHRFPHVGDNWDIGDHSYGSPSVFEPGMAKLTIGRFVSIAGGSAIALGGHRTDTISSFPFAALRHVWPAALGGSSHDSKGDVVIGNDVWIGYCAFIGSGVTVGDGAVIAALATVTKDVPPYAVVAGNPGRIVRYRFPPETIERLLAIKWWNWEDEVIAAALPIMTSGNMDDFFAYCEHHDLAAG